MDKKTTFPLMMSSNTHILMTLALKGPADLNIMRDTLKISPLNFDFFETIPKGPKSTTRAKQITLKGSKITPRGLKSTEKKLQQVKN